MLGSVEPYILQRQQNRRDFKMRGFSWSKHDRLQSPLVLLWTSIQKIPTIWSLYCSWWCISFLRWCPCSTWQAQPRRPEASPLIPPSLIPRPVSLRPLTRPTRSLCIPLFSLWCPWCSFWSSVSCSLVFYAIGGCGLWNGEPRPLSLGLEMCRLIHRHRKCIVTMLQLDIRVTFEVSKAHFHNWQKSLQMFRGIILKKIQTGFRTILKLLLKNTSTRISCIKMGRYIH